MFGSPKRHWLKPLARRSRQPIRTRCLTVTALEEREVPAAFTAGDLVIYRVGDGTAALAGTGTAVFLDEYTPAGALVQSITVPTSTLLATGNSTTEGIINLSQDGSHLIFTGYNTTVGGLTNASGNTSPRVFETADPSGTLATLATLPSTATVGGGTATVRSADAVTGTSNDPGLYFITSSNVAYLPSAATNGTNIDARNSRQVFLANNTVYASNASTAIAQKIQSYGTLPTTTTVGTNIGPNAFFPTADAVNGFAVLDLSSGVAGPDTVYYLDTTQSKLGKFTFDGTNWTDSGSVTSTATDLTAVVSGTNVQLFMTATASLTTLTDTSGYGGTLTGTPTSLATPGTNTAFRGLAPVPKSATGTGATTVTVSPSSNNVPVGTTVTFTATVTATSGSIAPGGSVAFKYNGSTFGVANLAQVGSTNSSQATFMYSGLPIGTDTVTAAYTGDPNFAPNSNTTSVTVTGSATTTAVSSNAPQPSVGQSVQFTATVMATSGTATPAGTVVFYDDGLALNASGIAVSGSGTTATAQLTVATNAIQAAQKLTPGSHTITAIFTPNPGFTGSTGVAVQNVKANPFTAGDLLVYRVGDGTSTLSATGNVVYIDEYNPTTASQTAPIQSIVMPSTPTSGGNLALISSAQQSTEGQLTLSADGQYVYLTGYDSTLGGAVTLNTATAAAIPRTIGRIKYDGTIDTSMALTDLASGGSVRGVTSPDGTQFYAAGSTGGVRYVSSYTAGLQTSIQVDSGANGTNGYTSAVPWTNLVISNGQLFGTDNSTVTVGGVTQNTVKVATIGTGLPTTAGNTVAIVPGLPTTIATSSGNFDISAPSFPYGLFFAHLNPGPETYPDTMYVADEGINFVGGQITKWAFVSGTYTKVSFINSNGTDPNTSPIPSFNQLNGVVNGSTVKLYPTYGNGGSPTGPGYLYSITDTGGYNATVPDPTVTTLASVSPTSLKTFRGVAPVPTGPAAQPINISSIQVNDGSNQRSEVRSITVTFNGAATFAGSGTVNQNAAAAFELDHINDLSSHFGTPIAVGLTANVTTNGSNQTVVMLTFSGSETDAFSTSGNGGPFSLPIAGLSLADGRYTLTAFAGKISGPGGGSFNGGSNFATTPDTVGGSGLHMYREFGDQTGDGVNDSTDLGQFRATFNANSSQGNYIQSLDANNDGVVDSTDLGQYRTRFNLNVYQ